VLAHVFLLISSVLDHDLIHVLNGDEYAAQIKGFGHIETMLDLTHLLVRHCLWFFSWCLLPAGRAPTQAQVYCVKDGAALLSMASGIALDL